MREIKFRAWDGKGYTSDFFITSEGTVFKPHYDREAEMVSSLTVEQFTGLHDKNGKEIYEGDILHTNEADWIAKVIWNYDGFMLTGLNNTGFSCSPDYDKCEVIGNINENPELING